MMTCEFFVAGGRTVYKTPPVSRNKKEN